MIYIRIKHHNNF